LLSNIDLQPNDGLIKAVVFCFEEGLMKYTLFTGHGGAKGGRCRVLLYLSFKTAHQAAMET